MKTSGSNLVEELAQLPEDHYYANILNDDEIKQSDFNPNRLMPLWKNSDYSIIVMITLGAITGTFVSNLQNIAISVIIAVSTVVFISGFIISLRAFFNTLTRKRKAKAVACISSIFDILKKDGWEPDYRLTPESVWLDHYGDFNDKSGYRYILSGFNVDAISITATMELVDTAVHKRKQEIKRQLKIEDLTDEYERTVASFDTEEERESFKAALRFSSANII